MMSVLPNMDLCYVILQFVIFEKKWCFDHELKIEKMAVSVVLFVF